ncbi:serine/threonine protein kinase [Aquincola tertiaricarbonis]|uniref:Serine/threonine protein kinase n=1 Tax=Aquincola tertiaricarbonis TaxID=391953 RepID=A0ABY4S695_AQUTE|nr:serine/threonine-protein kinase [Aquincola tertiaricarbonis]URI06734.1 serine/threonine protein kinase [Aquincola tertiaricarbonis]
MKPSSIAALQADWPAVSDLLDEALALPPMRREAWLDALAGPEARHRDTLRALLATQAEIETGDFLGALPPLPATEATAGAVPGAIVGPYRLVSQIGRGGMASVWLAERVDGLVKRPVALKLPAVAWGEAFATRLVREREILAGLAHEHIARLYDAGVDAQGRPYLAMAYVDGQPIDAYCRQHQLPLKARVALLLQVMAAVAHAHGRLVVHRDLKPSNILVTAEGQVSLLDFGIAKLLQDGELTQETALTRLGGHALTPDYASPEQIRGEPLGTATDVYSLGMVAYELLAGRLPYRLPRGGSAELLQAIDQVQLPRASQVAAEEPQGRAHARALQGDLDAILHRALKPRPEERYGSVDAFAQDLRRWRDGEPVQARPDSLAYRTGKFIARHRLQVGAGAVAVVALLAGSGVALWQAREARAQAELALTEAATARSVQAFLESVFMTNTGHQDDPEAARRTTARELLDRGAARIERELADVPEAQLRLNQTMQEMYIHMGLNERATALQRRSLALAMRLHGADSAQAIEARTSLGKSLIEMNQRDEGREQLLAAEAASQRVPGLDPGLRMTIDQTLSFLFINEDPVRAADLAARAAQVARQLPPSQDTLNALQMLGETSFKLGRLPEAEAALREAAAQIERHPDLGGGALPVVLATLGTTQAKRGRPQEALDTLQRAQAQARHLGDPYSQHIVAQKLISAHTENSQAAEALALGTAEVAWARGAGADFGALPLLLVGHQARALVAHGEPAAALALLQAWQAQVGGLPPDLQVGLLAVRADARVALGRAAEARADLERALPLVGEHAPFVMGELRQVRRRWWVAQGQAAQALQDFRGDAFVTAPSPGPLVTVRRQAEEAGLLLAAGHASLAADLAAQGLAAVAGLPDRRFVRQAEADLAEVRGLALLRQGQVAGAVPALAQAVALRRDLQDPRSPALARGLAALAEAQAASGQPAAAGATRAAPQRLQARP